MDLAVLTAYASLIAFGRFAWTLWKYGHKLDSTAPMDVEPFTPAIVGSKRIANFISSSYPRLGSLLLAAIAVGVWVLLLWSLWQGRQQARLAAAAPAAAPDTADAAEAEGGSGRLRRVGEARGGQIQMQVAG